MQDLNTDEVKEDMIDSLAELAKPHCEKLSMVLGAAGLMVAVNGSAGVASAFTGAAAASSLAGPLVLGGVMGLLVGMLACDYATEEGKEHAKRFMSNAEFRKIHSALNARVPMSEDESKALIALAVKSDADPHPMNPVIVTELGRVLKAAREA